MSEARGIRNNNPTNLVRSPVQWDGLSKDQTDPRFCQFVSPVYGIRAAFRNIETHIWRNGGWMTPRQIVSFWAPPVENDTASYVTNACKWAGLAPDAALSWSMKSAMVALMRGIIVEENGHCPYDPQVISDAYDMACSTSEVQKCLSV